MFEKYALPIIGLFSLVFLFNFLWVFQGLDLTDTGYDLANQALSLSNDVKKEVVTAVYLTDLIGGIWLRLYPQPSLIWARLGLCLLNAVNAVIVYLTLRRFYHGFDVFLTVLGSSVFVSACQFIRIIDYYTLPSLILNIGLYLFSCSLQCGSDSRRFKLLNFMLGFAFIPATLARLNLALTAVIPPIIAMYLVFTKSETHRLKKSLVYLVLGVFVSTVVFGAIYSILGATEPYISAVKILILQQHKEDLQGFYAYSQLIERLTNWYKKIALYTVAFITCLVLVGSLNKKVGSESANDTVLLVLASFLLIQGGAYNSMQPFTLLVNGLAVVYTIVYASKDRSQDKRISQLLIAASCIMLIGPVGSTSGIFKSGYDMWMILPLMLLSGRTLGQNLKNDIFRKIMSYNLTSIVIVIVYLSFFYQYYSIYRDDGRSSLTQGFHHPTLELIFSSKTRVNAVDGALAEIGKRANKGEKVLMLNSIPMLYYLTKTKPAFGSTWLFMETKEKIANITYEAVKKGQLPRLIVYSKIDFRGFGNEERTNAFWGALKKANVTYNKTWENDGFVIYTRAQ